MNDLRGWQTPAFHLEMAYWLEGTMDVPRRVAMAFRDAGKSVIIGQYYPMWRLLCDPEHTILIISAQGGISGRNVRSIRSLMESAPLLEHLVSDEELWKRDEFTVQRNTKGAEPSVKMLSAGANSKITGHHAKEVILDDLEVPLTCKTEENREQLWDTYQEIECMAHHILDVGTPHTEDTFHLKLVRDAGFILQKWPVVLEDGLTPTDPDRHGAEWIKAKKAILSDGKWRSQYMLENVSVDGSTFDLSMIRLYEDDVAVLEGMDTWLRSDVKTYSVDGKNIIDVRCYYDPASGLKYRDNAVVGITMKTEEGDVYVPDLDVLPAVDSEEGMRPQFEGILQFMRRNNLNEVVVEKNWMFTIATELRRYAKERGYKIRVKEAGRYRATGKNEWIADTLGPLIQTRRLFVHKKVWDNTPLRKEMLDFPGGKHDDTLDTLTGAIQELRKSRVEARNEALLANGYRSAPKGIVINSPVSRPMDVTVN